MLHKDAWETLKETGCVEGEIGGKKPWEGGLWCFLSGLGFPGWSCKLMEADANYHLLKFEWLSC